MSWHFHELFSRKVQKGPHSWKSTRNHRFGQNYVTFRTNYHVFVFRWTFKEKVGKSGWFREKARKIMDLVKTCNFSNKLPCFDVSMNFSANSCKNCLISWKSTKSHRFGQTMQLFLTNYHVLVFRWTFPQKVAKRGSIPEKARKIIDLAKNFATFRTNYHIFAFQSTFQEKVAKSASFRQKARKIIHLAKSL